MWILFAHIVRLLIDLGLLFLLRYLEIYELTDVLMGLIAARISVGHFGRIFQFVIGVSDDIEGCAAGLFANIIKTALEAAILLNLYDEISFGIAVLVIGCILARNIFEAVSLCEEFGE